MLKKAHGLVLIHEAFVGILTLWIFLLGFILVLLAFLALVHMSQGQIMWRDHI